MRRKAVDVVLLPDESMMDKAIDLNRELVRKFGKKIVLDRESCLPHISLAMGCADERNIVTIKGLLQKVLKRPALAAADLSVAGIRIVTNSVGEKVSVFEVEKTNELQLLHEEFMAKLAPYLSRNAAADMVYGKAEVERSTLLWIKNYPEKSSWANFSPHITIGYGEIKHEGFPIKFTATRLALCHLGNHCTCRQILASVKLERP